MDDVEALFEMNREQLGFIPEEKGGEVAGRFVHPRQGHRTGKRSGSIARVRSGAYSNPISVDISKFSRRREFILAIETAGMVPASGQAQLLEAGRMRSCVDGGVPTRACRRFIRALADFKKIPVYVFVDGDPYGSPTSIAH